MELIKPSIEFIDEVDPVRIMKKLELIGRVCYKSEDAIGDDTADVFIGKVLRLGHESVIEHESISVRVICDRGVSHEIVRHRIASYSQESTRYCNYTKNAEMKFIIPAQFLEGLQCLGEGTFNYSDLPHLELDNDQKDWLNSLLNAETTYNSLIMTGWSPQRARSVLPNSLKTEIVMTMNLREWRHFFSLRCAKAAHPDMRVVANMIVMEMYKKLPVIFGDLQI